MSLTNLSFIHCSSYVYPYSRGRERPPSPPRRCSLTTNPEELLGDDVDCLVEVAGGTTTACAQPSARQSRGASLTAEGTVYGQFQTRNSSKIPKFLK